MRQLHRTMIGCIAIGFVCAIPGMAPADASVCERAYQHHVHFTEKGDGQVDRHIGT